jgi:hypothetical protein
MSSTDLRLQFMQAVEREVARYVDRLSPCEITGCLEWVKWHLLNTLNNNLQSQVQTDDDRPDRPEVV